MTSPFAVVDALTTIRRAATEAGIDIPPALVFRTMRDRDQFLAKVAGDMRLHVDMVAANNWKPGDVPRLAGIAITDRGAAHV